MKIPLVRAEFFHADV